MVCAAKALPLRKQHHRLQTRSPVQCIGSSRVRKSTLYSAFQNTSPIVWDYETSLSAKNLITYPKGSLISFFDASKGTFRTEILELFCFVKEPDLRRETLSLKKLKKKPDNTLIITHFNQLRTLKRKEKPAQRGARTHDPEIKSLMLCRLS